MEISAAKSIRTLHRLRCGLSARIRKAAVILRIDLLDRAVLEPGQLPIHGWDAPPSFANGSATGSSRRSRRIPIPSPIATSKTLFDRSQRYRRRHLWRLRADHRAARMGYQGSSRHAALPDDQELGDDSFECRRLRWPAVLLRDASGRSAGRADADSTASNIN